MNRPPFPADAPNQDRRSSPGTHFDASVTAVLQELHEALSSILDHLRPQVVRASDLRRVLNLDQQLSWSIFNAATAHDPRALASLIPGRRAMGRFLSAAAVQGVPESAIARARVALDRFEQSIAQHARSREAFEVMVGGLRDTGSEAKHKRSAFRTNSVLWGRQARAGFAAVAVHPSAQAGKAELLDWLILSGAVGLHRTRRGVPLSTVGRVWWMRSEGDPSQASPLTALDPRESEPDSIGLLRDFCSQPLPQFRVIEREEGFSSHELIDDGLGATSELTYMTGHVVRAFTAPPRPGSDSEVTTVRTIATPVEVQISDVLMHESIWDDQLPEVRVYAFPTRGSAFRDSDLLPLTETASYLGRGLNSGWTPLVPRYTEMMTWSLERLGWNPDEFRIFRCQVDYPVLYSQIRMRFAR